jgi:hypothetical protein
MGDIGGSAIHLNAGDRAIEGQLPGQWLPARHVAEPEYLADGESAIHH